MILNSFFLSACVLTVNSASSEQTALSFIQQTLANAKSNGEEENDELFYQSVLSLASSMLTAFEHMEKVPVLLGSRRKILERLNRAETEIMTGGASDTQINLINRSVRSLKEFSLENEPLLTVYTEELTTVIRGGIEVIALRGLSKHKAIRDKLGSMLHYVDEVNRIGNIQEASFGSSHGSSQFPTFRGRGLLMRQDALERQYLLHVNFSKELKEVIQMEMSFRISVLDDLMKSFPKDKVDEVFNKIVSKGSAAEEDDWIPQHMRPTPKKAGNGKRKP